MKSATIRTALAASIGLAAVTGGCSVTHQWIYEKNGMTVESLDRDRAGCRAAAPPTGLSAMLKADDVDRDAFTRCMEQRGYTARREVL